MCDWPDCGSSEVCIVDADPRGATILRPVVGENGPMFNVDGSAQTYDLAVGAQRFSYCVTHSATLGLTEPINKGHLVAGESGNVLPAGHVLFATYRWVLDG